MQTIASSNAMISAGNDVLGCPCPWTMVKPPPVTYNEPAISRITVRGLQKVSFVNDEMTGKETVPSHHDPTHPLGINDEVCGFSSTRVPVLVCMLKTLYLKVEMHAAVIIPVMITHTKNFLLTMPAAMHAAIIIVVMITHFKK